MATVIKICCARSPCAVTTKLSCVVHEGRVWSRLSARELSSTAGVFIVRVRYEKRVKFTYSDQEEGLFYMLYGLRYVCNNYTH